MSTESKKILAELDKHVALSKPLSKFNEPPVGTWVKDKYGANSYHQVQGGWGEPGFFPTGKWVAMWDARGPYKYCGPWGAELPKGCECTCGKEGTAQQHREAILEKR